MTNLGPNSTKNKSSRVSSTSSPPHGPPQAPTPTSMTHTTSPKAHAHTLLAGYHLRLASPACTDRYAHASSTRLPTSTWSAPCPASSSGHATLLTSPHPFSHLTSTMLRPHSNSSCKNAGSQETSPKKTVLKHGPPLPYYHPPPHAISSHASIKRPNASGKN